MKTKICPTCGIEKPVNEFGKDKYSKDKLRSHCKTCVSEYDTRRYRANPEKERLRNKIYKKQNPVKIKINHKKWCKKNPDKLRAIEQKRNKKRYGTPTGKTRRMLSTALRECLGPLKAGRKTSDLLEYTNLEFRKDRKTKFYGKMTEKSFGQGKVHHHHVVTVKSHNITSAECADFKKCWALSNLQPLWKEDHIALHQRLDPELRELMLTKPTYEQIEKLCRKHLKYTLKHSVHNAKVN